MSIPDSGSSTRLSLPSVNEQYPPSSGNAAKPPCPITLCENLSGDSSITLKERVALVENSSSSSLLFSSILLGSTPDDKDTEEAACAVPSVAQPTVSKEDLLIEAGRNGITILGETACMKKRRGSEAEQWECLKKIHECMPITDLRFEKNVNIESLLLFLKSNKGLISLSLGRSPDVTDSELEKILPYLPALKSFSIESAKITHIPESLSNRAETLSVRNCGALVSINAAVATEIDCWGCTALTTLNAYAAPTIECLCCNTLITLNAPVATMIECSGCYGLITLRAPAATRILCKYCIALTTLDAPVATTIEFEGCKALMFLNAPAATRIECADFTALVYLNAASAITIECADCTALTVLIAPMATRIECSGCIFLTSLDAPAAIEVECDQCTALTTLNAPTAITIYCWGCTSLTSINAPNAKKVHCFNCIALPALYAPMATTIYCAECKSLTFLNAPAATSISGLRDTALSGEAQQKVLTSLRRNIIMRVYYMGVDKNFDKFMKKMEKIKETPLNQWFKDASSFSLPADFDSKAEELKSKEKISDFFNRLIALADAEDLVKKENLTWFKNLNELDSLQQQMKRIIWLGALVMCSAPGKNPIADPGAHSTLTAIGNLANPFLQHELTQTLLSIYNAPQQLRVWTDARSAGLKKHQILLCLLFSKAKFRKKSIEDLVEIFKSRYYQNADNITPILEMVCMLSPLSSVQQESLLTLIFKALTKEKEEAKHAFNARVAERKKEQARLVAACRDLLFFAKSDALINVTNESDLLEKHKRISQEIFGIREEFVHKFSGSFTSKRHFNALPTYAARLQTLPMDEKKLLTNLLGKFVNAHLEGSFPDNRYDLSVNPHLAIIFKDNPILLEKWMLPLEIDLAPSEKLQQSSPSNTHDIVKRLMTDAIANKHLGDNQDARFPTLIEVLATKSFEAIPASLKKLQEEFNLLVAPGEVDKRKDLAIEMECLKALDPNAAATAGIAIFR